MPYSGINLQDTKPETIAKNIEEFLGVFASLKNNSANMAAKLKIALPIVNFTAGLFKSDESSTIIEMLDNYFSRIVRHIGFLKSSLADIQTMADGVKKFQTGSGQVDDALFLQLANLTRTIKQLFSHTSFHDLVRDLLYLSQQNLFEKVSKIKFDEGHEIYKGLQGSQGSFKSQFNTAWIAPVQSLTRFEMTLKEALKYFPKESFVDAALSRVIERITILNRNLNSLEKGKKHTLQELTSEIEVIQDSTPVKPNRQETPAETAKIDGLYSKVFAIYTSKLQNSFRINYSSDRQDKLIFLDNMLIAIKNRQYDFFAKTVEEHQQDWQWAFWHSSLTNKSPIHHQSKTYQLFQQGVALFEGEVAKRHAISSGEVAKRLDFSGPSFFSSGVPATPPAVSDEDRSSETDESLLSLSQSLESSG